MNNDHMNICKICKKNSNFISFGVCESCIKKGKTFETAYFVGKSNNEAVNINGFLSFCFSQSEIDDILYDEFMSYPERVQNRFINDYYNANTSCFVKGIEKKCK